jgi:hypothetical protein
MEFDESRCGGVVPLSSYLSVFIFLSLRERSEVRVLFFVAFVVKQ